MKNNRYNGRSLKGGSMCSIRRKRLIIIFLIILIVIMISGCKKKETQVQNTNSISTDEKESTVNKENKDDNRETDKENSTDNEEKVDDLKEKTKGINVISVLNKVYDVDWNIILDLSDRYDWVGQVIGGYARVRLNGKYGLINEKGEELIAPKYDEIDHVYKNSEIVVAKLGTDYQKKCGLVNITNGKELTDFDYYEISVLEDNMAVLLKDIYSECGEVVDKNGNIVIKKTKEYEGVRAYGYSKEEKLFTAAKKVEKNQYGEDRYKYGFIDINGKVVIDIQYDDVTEFRDGRAVVKQGSYMEGYQCTFIDRKGNTIQELKYDDVKPLYYNGLSIVRVGNGDTGLHGLIDRTGKELIEPKYASLFSIGLDDYIEVSVFSDMDEREKKWGIIDKFGKEIIPPIYDHTYHHSGDFFMVEENDKYGFVDKQGKVVVPIEYDYAGIFRDDLVSVEKVWVGSGIFDASGKEVIPVGRYKKIEIEDKDIIIASDHNDCYGVIDVNENIKIPFEYSFGDIHFGSITIEDEGKVN